MVFSFVFKNGISLCVNVCLCNCMCFLCILFCSFLPFVCLLCHILVGQLVFIFLFYHHFIFHVPFYILMRSRKKYVDLGGWGSGGDLEGAGWWKTLIRIYCIKNPFLIRKEENQVVENSLLPNDLVIEIGSFNQRVREERRKREVKQFCFVYMCGL